ncbi:MAG: ABC transporter ATP-binding protein [Desulfobulbaceae bacterium]|nr:ABC transporter ATP-binding protein [Desulfobulbaceae bacterium]
MRNFGYDEEGWKGSLHDHHIWRRIHGYSRGYLPGLFGAVLLSLLVTAATLGLPRLMQHAIDQYITAAGMAAAVRIEGLAGVAGIYGILVVVIFMAGFLQVVILEKIGQSIMDIIRQELFSHLLELDLAFFNNQPVGRLVTRLTNDIQNMHEMFTSVMVTLFNDLLKLAGILVVLFFMNARLALVMSLFVPLSFIITLIFSRLARENFRAIRSQLARLNSYLQESISGLTIIQLFNRQDDSREKYENLSLEYYRRTLGQIKLFGTFMPLTELMSSVAIAVIVWYGGGEIMRQQMTLGELVAFFSYMRLFFQPMRELSQKYSIVQSALASAERIFDLLDTGKEIASPAVPLHPERTRGEIVFDRVSFGYDAEEPVIRGISLEIEPGETVAVVGATGAGKTSLINLLIRFYDPQEGRILLDGVDLRDYRIQDLRQRIGIIMQDVVILPDTLLANIVMETGTDRSRVEEIIEKTGMRSFVAGLPEGLDTRIGEGSLDLSSGEKQLLCFARVLCRDPRVLILDEATASVDSQTENILEQAIAASFENRTSLVIAHRLSTIRRADRIVVMDSGMIREQGTHDELMALEGIYANLVRLDLHANGKNGGLIKNERSGW